MDLAQLILSKMPKELNDLEKARYLYVELARQVTFSTKFQNTDERSFYLMYKAKVDIRHVENFQINCVMWSQLYSQLLNLVGIKNRIVNHGHQYVEFYLENKKIVADATDANYTDLSGIRNYDSTQRFGPCIFQDKERESNIVNPTIEWEDQLDYIDKKIGYNCNKKKKLKEIKELLTKIQNNKLGLKELFPFEEIPKEHELCFKLEYLYELIGPMKDGYYESKDFVKYLQDIMLTKEEKANVDSSELKRTNSDGSVDIIQCIYVKVNDSYHYYLLAPGLKIHNFNERQIQLLSVRGYCIDRKSIPGISFPRKFIAGKISENLTYKLYKKLVRAKIIKPNELDKYANQSSRRK